MATGCQDHAPLGVCAEMRTQRDSYLLFVLEGHKMFSLFGKKKNQSAIEAASTRRVRRIQFMGERFKELVKQGYTKGAAAHYARTWAEMECKRLFA